MHLIDLTIPLPPAWPPPRTGSEFELLVHYLRRRDPIGYRVHLTLAFGALFLAPLWQAPSAIAFGILAGYALLRLPNTWRCCSALLSEPAMVAWMILGSLLAISILWNPFAAEYGLDHLRAWRVMLYPLLLLPVLPSRRIMLVALLLGGFMQVGFMSTGDSDTSLYQRSGPLHNVNIAGMWGAVLATAGTAALLWGRWWGLLVMAVGVTISLFSGSRGSLTAMAAGVAVVLGMGMLVSRGHERWWRLGRVLLPLAAAAVLALAVLPMSAQRIQRSLTQITTAESTSDHPSSALLAVDPARFQLWRLAMLKAQERPILGWGFGAYPSITTSTIDTFDRTWWALPEEVRSVSTISYFRGSHSMYMRIACEQGLIGLLTLLAALTFTIEALDCLTRRSAMALGGLGVVVAWMVFAGTEDAHTMTRALLPVPLVLALVILGDHFDAGEQA